MKILEKPITKTELIKTSENFIDENTIKAAVEIKYIHSEEARRDWGSHPITYQMGNIGSEVSRALKWTAKGNQKRADAAIDRALELFDFTIAANINNPPHLREILIAREEFCDYFFGGNSWQTDPTKMQKYYDGFVMMEQLKPVHPIYA